MALYKPQADDDFQSSGPEGGVAVVGAIIEAIESLEAAAASGGGAALATDAPAALGVAAVGTGTTAARADHVHKMPTAAEVGALPVVDPYSPDQEDADHVLLASVLFNVEEGGDAAYLKDIVERGMPGLPTVDDDGDAMNLATVLIRLYNRIVALEARAVQWGGN